MPSYIINCDWHQNIDNWARTTAKTLIGAKREATRKFGHRLDKPVLRVAEVVNGDPPFCVVSMRLNRPKCEWENLI